jgi:hypothetical protein
MRFILIQIHFICERWLSRTDLIAAWESARSSTRTRLRPEIDAAQDASQGELDGACLCSNRHDLYQDRADERQIDLDYEAGKAREKGIYGSLKGIEPQVMISLSLAATMSACPGMESSQEGGSRALRNTTNRSGSM